MLDFSQANIVRSAVTWVGNKEQNEGIVVPNSTLITVNDYIHEILGSDTECMLYFLK